MRWLKIQRLIRLFHGVVVEIALWFGILISSQPLFFLVTSSIVISQASFVSLILIWVFYESSAMKGFRKIDPDRWEFANEGFLAGQKHLLKNIKRRRNIGIQNLNQQGSGSGMSCVEVGQYGFDQEVERLKRDHSVLVAEVVKLRQQQHSSKSQIAVMEQRLLITEKRQQQMMTFLAKALNNPNFVQQFALISKEKKSLFGLDVGRKRRLTSSPSLGTLDENVLHDEEFDQMKDDMETLLAAAIDNESSNLLPSKEEQCLEAMNSMMEDSNLETEMDMKVEDLVSSPLDWGNEDLHDIVDQMGFLGSKP